MIPITARGVRGRTLADSIDAKREAKLRYAARNREKNNQRAAALRAKQAEIDPEYNKKRKKQWREAAYAFAAGGRIRPDTCDICGSDWRIAFDHCHTGGHFRGWLCQKCNTILGLAGDDPERLRKLATYLDEDRSRSKQQSEVECDEYF